MKLILILMTMLLSSCATDGVNLLLPDSLVIGSGFTSDWEHRTNTVSLFWSLPQFVDDAPTE